jgi:hypothetical protein
MLLADVDNNLTESIRSRVTDAIARQHLTHTKGGVEMAKRRKKAKKVKKTTKRRKTRKAGKKRRR